MNFWRVSSQKQIEGIASRWSMCALNVHFHFKLQTIPNSDILFWGLRDGQPKGRYKKKKVPECFHFFTPIIYLAVTLFVSYYSVTEHKRHGRDVMWVSSTNRSTWIYVCARRGENCVFNVLCVHFPWWLSCGLALVTRGYQRLKSVQSSSVIFFFSCSSSTVSMVTEASQSSLPLHSCRACGASTPTWRRQSQTLAGSPGHLQNRKGDSIREFKKINKL